MKKFILKTIIFTAIALSILFVLNHLYVNTNYYKSKRIYKFNEVPTELEIANIGSSHGEKAFNYSETELNGFNFSLHSQRYYYDYQILKQYLNNFENNSVILIPVSYFSFWNNDLDSDRFKELNSRYYNFLEIDKIIDFEIPTFIKEQLFPILSSSMNLKYLINDKSTLVDKQQMLDKNQFDRNELNDVGKERAGFHLKSIREGQKKLGTSTIYLEQIIKLSKNNNLIPVLITTPFTKYYNKNFSTEFYNTFDALVAKVSEQYDILYLDYSHDNEFTNNPEFFLDSDHLNLKGRKIFTKKVLSNLKERNIIKRIDSK